MQHVTGPNQGVAYKAFQELCEILGPAVSFDAAAAGSRCHRARNWWSNVWDPVTVQHVFNEVHRLKLRPAVKPVQSVLRPGWKAPRAKTTGAPYYPCNGLEVEREALPTLVTYELSHAFRGMDGLGVLVRESDGARREPDVEERELLMGYWAGATAAEGVSIQTRYKAVGNAWNIEAAAALWAVAQNLARTSYLEARPAIGTVKMISREVPAWAFIRGDPLPYDALEDYCPKGLDLLERQLGVDEKSEFKISGIEQRAAPVYVHPRAPNDKSGLGMPPGTGAMRSRREKRARHMTVKRPAKAHRPSNVVAAVRGGVDTGFSTFSKFVSAGVSSLGVDKASATALFAARAQGSEAVIEENESVEELARNGAKGNSDPWKDEAFMDFMKAALLPKEISSGATRAIRRRAADYKWNGEKQELSRMMRDGTVLMVPAPDNRVGVIKQIHHQSGHMGVARTEALVRRLYWWPALSLEVRRVLKQCSACDQVRAGPLGSHKPELRPLPLTTVGYRFSLDWAGGFPTSEVGNQHLLIVVEHSTRWVEVFPAPVKNAKTSAMLFRYLVIARFGCPAEVLTDGGPEFEGEFAQLMKECLIDHRLITPGNPQANGLSERIVGLFKRASAKLGAAGFDENTWDSALADVLRRKAA